MVTFESICFDEFISRRGGNKKLNEAEVRISTSTDPKYMAFSKAFSEELEARGMKYLTFGRLTDSYEVIFRFSKEYEKDAIKLIKRNNGNNGSYTYWVTGKFLVPQIMKVLRLEGDKALVRLADNTSRTEDYIVRRVINL